MDTAHEYANQTKRFNTNVEKCPRGIDYTLAAELLRAFVQVNVYSLHQSSSENKLVF